MEPEMNRAFQNAVGKMKRLMDKLLASEELRWADYRLAPEKGVYVFYEKGEPIYVGRSNRMRSRIREHGAKGSRRYSATFALKLLEETLPQQRGKTKRDLEENHPGEYSLQKARVRDMTFRAVEIKDQLKQTLFEVYAILEMGTNAKYNDFDTH